ncbi:endonuclease domain-containing protein [Streptomyces sp. NPDC094153]|uniref:endonuclease domain-containing protein n=1 Tax=Streptomyces sp. NPDC094153 TaxID=3366058 RepID=UPI003809914C
MSSHTRPRGRSCSHRIYQLDCEAYDRLVDHAGNRCQVCGVTPEQTKHGFLVIDHDVREGQWAVRGLLCSKCNTAIPFGSAPDWAAEYLSAPWWREELSRLGHSAEAVPEPHPGSVVVILNRFRWRRDEKGWRHAANYRHNPAQSWERLNYRFGPHNIRVLSADPTGA